MQQCVFGLPGYIAACAADFLLADPTFYLLPIDFSRFKVKGAVVN
jgi:hypothetical protein